VPIAFTLPDEASRPASTADLDPSERFIVWAFRRWVLGLQQNNGEHWSLVWSEFTRQFGVNDGREALSGFARVIKELQCHARRNIHHHHPCCPCLCADEISLVYFVAACQNRQSRLARGLAEWLVRPDGAGDLLEAATRLAGVMRRHALHLPVRTKKTAFDTESAEPPRLQITVH